MLEDSIMLKIMLAYSAKAYTKGGLADTLLSLYPCIVYLLNLFVIVVAIFMAILYPGGMYQIYSHEPEGTKRPEGG